MNKDSQKVSPIKVLFTEHKPLAIGLIAGIIVIIILLVLILLNSPDNDGVEGDDSRFAEKSMLEDQKAFDSFPITHFLPIVSKDPAYTISYILEKDDDSSTYTLKLSLSAFSASAREAMVKRFISEDFGEEDPLKYEVVLENYYNPFTPYTLDDLKDGDYPDGFSKNNLYAFGDSSYTVQTLTHTLYDGSANTYRYILENGEPKTMPKLFFTYSELPFLSESQVSSLNSLE